MKALALALLALGASACAQEAPVQQAPTQEPHRTVPLPIGDTAATAEVVERAGCDVDVLVLHDNENTGVEAARAVIAERGGRLVDLRHAGTRNLAFRVGADSFAVDPNRVFTDAGAARTLADLASDTPAARRAVRRFAARLLGVYGTPAVVVTAHNNTDARYSAESYAEGGAYAGDAAAVHLVPGADTDDFFFVTDRALFDALAAQGFNAVLQDNAAATDDGSLSVWAAQQGVPYVNVEAEHGHREEQVRMLHALWGELCD